MKWISSGILASGLVVGAWLGEVRAQPPNSPFAPPPVPPTTTPAQPPTTGPFPATVPPAIPAPPTSFEPVPYASQPATSATFSPAQIVAIVGNQHVLAGDVEGAVNQMLAINLANIPAEQREQYASQIERQKQALMRQQIQSEVQNKLLYLDFLRMGIPKDKLADVHKRIGSGFEADLDAMRTKVAGKKPEDFVDHVRRDPVIGRLAVLMEMEKLETLGELDQALRKHGSSLEKQQRAYMEHRISQSMIGKNIKQNVEVTHEQMLEYYRQHHEEYAIAAKARWEQLSVYFDRFPTREAAYQAIAAMGNEVYLGGAQFTAVAKKGSQEPNADRGGQHDWTNKGSLASTVLDEAIFSLPINRLSQILEDDRGFHILRVLERAEAGATPFLEAQVEIKEKIKNQRRANDIKQYLDKVQKTATVWTIYDDPTANTAERATPAPF